jgi:hypothetical protein
MRVEPRKEIERHFFFHLNALLEEYIKPKEEDMLERDRISKEIYHTVEKFCSSKGWWWKMEYTELGNRPDYWDWNEDSSTQPVGSTVKHSSKPALRPVKTIVVSE